MTKTRRKRTDAQKALHSKIMKAWWAKRKKEAKRKKLEEFTKANPPGPALRISTFKGKTPPRKGGV